jgi:hypothetical protein
VRYRGAVAGAVAAAVWQASDPLLKRAFKTPYSDAELLGPFLTRGRYEWLANLVTHSTAGAGFGYLFERLGGRGPRQAIVVALAENTLLWPALGVFDRIHPKRRDGTWPPLVTSPRVFGQATAGHAFFGLLLGIGVR